MSTVMQFNLVLDAASGPGTLPARGVGCQGVSLFLISCMVVFADVISTN